MLVTVPNADASKALLEAQFNTATNTKLPKPGTAPHVRLLLPAPLNSEAMSFLEDGIPSHTRILDLIAGSGAESAGPAQRQADVPRGTEGPEVRCAGHSEVLAPEGIRDAEMARRDSVVQDLTKRHPEVEPMVEWLNRNREALGVGTAFFLTRNDIRAILPLGLDGSSFDIYYKSLREGAARIRRTRVLPELRTRRVDPSGVELYVGGRRGPKVHIEIAESELIHPTLAEEGKLKKTVEGGPSQDDEFAKRDQRTKEQLLRQCPEVESLAIWLTDHAASLESVPRLMTYKELRQLAPLGLAANEGNQLYFQRLSQWVRWMRRRKVFPQVHVRAMARPHGVSLVIRPGPVVSTASNSEKHPPGKERIQVL